jgi:hypothetical protein
MKPRDESRWFWVAYCSQQAAAFRGWEANLGPLKVVHLEPTFTSPRNVQSGVADSSKPFSAGTNGDWPAIGARR